MPLLNKKPFTRVKPPAPLAPDHELFFCHSTNEVFEDYEEFFQRTILCNSLVWTCEITGRPGLTYEEAVESEKRAKRVLNDFPEALKKPILYLATTTRRGRLAELCDDVFNFTKDRFFVGDIVEYTGKNSVRKQCVVLGVFPAKPDQTNDSGESTNSSDSDSSRSDAYSKSNDSCAPLKPFQCNYEIEDVETADILKVKCSAIFRRKGNYTREKNKLYLKQATHPVSGHWSIKDKYVDKYNLATTKFSDIFIGAPPQFKTTLMKKRPVHSNEHSNDHSKEPSKLQNTLHPEFDLQNAKKKFRLTEEEREMKKEAAKKKLEEVKKLRKEEKIKEKERKLEERRVMAQYAMEWSRPRDDLLCEDLKDILSPVPVKCDLPQEVLGDAFMIQQFLHIFSEVLEMKDHFPDGLNFETLQKALTSCETDSPLKDIFQFLLESIFSLQEDHSEIKFEDENSDSVTFQDKEAKLTILKALEQAEVAVKWSHRYYGTSIKNLIIDPFTVTEVLRLHLLSSGSMARRLEGCLPTEDPGLLFKLEHPEVINDLAVNNVFDLSIGSKLKLLNVLIHQIMANDVIRDYIDDAMINARQTRNDLRMLRFTEVQREREFAMKFKRLSDARTIEKYNKSKEEANAAENKVNNVVKEPAPDVNPVDEEIEKAKKMTDRQWEDYSEKCIREEAKKKEAFLKEERELMDSLVSNQMMSCISPLGRDRAFRRYWLFTCIPGLFVEDNDLQYMGKCLKSPTPHNPDMQSGDLGAPNLTLASMRKYLERSCGEKSVNSDKENEESDASADEVVVKKVSKVGSEIGLSEKNGDSKELGTLAADTDIDNVELKFSKIEMDKTPVFGMCTAAEETCPVHSKKVNRQEWSLYKTVESIENLISSLNPRGHRERELLENLKNEKWRLYDHLATCPSDLLPLQKDTVKVINSSAGVTSKIIELNIRDTIVDLEEKIYHGTLGKLQVNDRIAWRQAIDNESYDMQCSVLEWCGCSFTDIDKFCESNNCLHNDSANVKKLCCAVLQLAQGLEPKYLKQPLGEDAELKKQKIAESLIKKLERKSLESQSDADQISQKENDSATSSPMLRRTALERWSYSLMSCTSLSQLSLHISTFEQSVEWSRSILNAKCKICRRKTDAENMLLCDNCDRGHHLYCLKPPLMVVPKGRWFCPACRPKQTPVKRKPIPGRARKEVSEDDEDNNELLVNGKETALSDEEDESAEENMLVIEETVCDNCGKGGKMINCQHCQQHFHIYCITPKLRKYPKGKWTCPSCICDVKEKGDMEKKEIESKPKRAKTVISIPNVSKRSPRMRTTPKSLNDYDHQQLSSTDDLRPARRSSSGRRSYDESIAFNYKVCNDLLTELTKHEDGWLFLRPVTKKDASDYHLIIKNPMDFGTMRGKLNNVQYKDNAEFAADAQLVFKNCDLYNPDDSIEFKAGKRIQKFFEQRLKELGMTTVKEERTTGDEPASKRRR